MGYSAYSQTQQDGYSALDDVSLVERIGKKVKVIEASPCNFKITYPMDLELAKLLLRKRYV
jgi:2-C-methyl-D-erythritol 4-phosphate cytidylyltransferase